MIYLAEAEFPGDLKSSFSSNFIDFSDDMFLRHLWYASVKVLSKNTLSSDQIGVTEK